MTYELRFKLWCVLEDEPERKERVEEIDALNNETAIGAAGEFLRAQRRGAVIPYAPMLYCMGQLIASSVPSNPLYAHRLVWDYTVNAAIAA